MQDRSADQSDALADIVFSVVCTALEVGCFLAAKNKPVLNGLARNLSRRFNDRRFDLRTILRRKQSRYKRFTVNRTSDDVIGIIDRIRFFIVRDSRIDRGSILCIRPCINGAS